MKKFLSLALVLVMMMSLSVTAFAAEGSAENVGAGSGATIDVKAIYSSSASTPEIVSVDIAWGAMEFTYSVGGSHEWNPADHTYTDNTSASWSSSGNTVKVTNHSNVDVNVAFAFAAEAGSSVTGSFTYDKTATANTVALNKGVENAYAAADNVTATLTLGGTVPSTQTDFTKVGTITVVE